MTFASAPVPRRLGKYELIECIGSGGMAEVFRARTFGPLGFEREVVVKLIRPELAGDAMVLEMFSEEAKLAAQANHRNIVQVFELDATEDGFVFMAMEHVVGLDLKEVQLRAFDHDRRIPPWFSVHVAAEVLEGLCFVHSLVDAAGRPRNIVHRDVSPENIFISELGDVKLGDFGIARDDTRPKAHHGREIRGKPGYSAPEFTEGSEVDQRADVFSLGVVLWECLTQRPLVVTAPNGAAAQPSPDALRVPPSRFVEDIPPLLDQVVLRALAPDPSQRTPSTRLMRRELLDVLARMRPGRIDGREIAATFAHLVDGCADRRLEANTECEPEVAGGRTAAFVLGPGAWARDTTDAQVRFDDERSYAVGSPTLRSATPRAEENGDLEGVLPPIRRRFV